MRRACNILRYNQEVIYLPCLRETFDIELVLNGVERNVILGCEYLRVGTLIWRNVFYLNHFVGRDVGCVLLSACSDVDDDEGLRVR